MSAGGESCDADLAHPPFRGMEAAVAQRVLDVLQRYFPPAAGHPVFQDGAGDAPVPQPFGHVGAFAPGGESGISATGAADDHLPVAFGRQVEVDPGTVRHIEHETARQGDFRPLDRAFPHRPSGDSYAVFDDALASFLSERIEKDGFRGDEVPQSERTQRSQALLHREGRRTGLQGDRRAVQEVFLCFAPLGGSRGGGEDGCGQQGSQHLQDTGSFHAVRIVPTPRPGAGPVRRWSGRNR